MIDDMISRQAAIKALDAEIEITGRINAETFREYANLVIGRIKHLPESRLQCEQCKYRLAYAYSEKIAEYKPQGLWFTRKEKSGEKCRLIECNQCHKGYIVRTSIPLDEWAAKHKYCMNCGMEMSKGVLKV